MIATVFGPAIGLFVHRLKPTAEISDEDRGRGMQLVLADGLTSQAMETMAGGVFLTAFAVALNASNLTIGFLAAIPAIAQLMQIPGVVLVEHLRARRLQTVLGALVGRGSMVLIGALMCLMPDHALSLLVMIAIVQAAAGSIAGCSWNSWMRDLLPAQQLNQFFARRMMYSTLLGAVLSVVIVGLQGLCAAQWPDHRVMVFSLVFMAGGIAGLFGIVFVSRTPEPLMHARQDGFSMRALLTEPFRSTNYRRLMAFLAVWSFAVNLATPFFTVFMLRSLGLALPMVMALAVLGQLAHVLSIRRWAQSADRIGSKRVLRRAGYLYLIAMGCWMFTGRPDAPMMTTLLLVVLHIGMGVATAGFALGTAGMCLKLSPAGRATPYLAMNAVASAIAGGIAPIIGGATADYFATRKLGITIEWLSPAAELSISALQMRSWQFYFAISFGVGIYALSRLRLVREPNAAIGGRYLVWWSALAAMRRAAVSRRGAVAPSADGAHRAFVTVPSQSGGHEVSRSHWERKVASSRSN